MMLVVQLLQVVWNDDFCKQAISCSVVKFVCFVL